MSAVQTEHFSSLGHGFGFDKGCMIGVVCKQHQDERLGVGFRDTKDGVVLGRLQMRFEKETDLVSGLKVLHINGVPVDCAQQAATIVKTVGKGQVVSVAVDGVCLQATKKRKAERPGFSLESQNGIIKISKTSVKGHFPSLQPGQRLVAVNGHAISTVYEATKLMNQKKDLTIVVVSEDEDMSDTSSTTLCSTFSHSVTDELDLLEPIHFQMQDFEDENNKQ